MSYNNSGQRQDRPNTGVLFTNDRKATDRHPDMTGYLLFDTDVMEALVKGHRAGMPMKLQISAWMGRSSRGSDYLSIRFGTRDTPIEQGQRVAQNASAPPQPVQQAVQQAPTQRLSGMMPRSPAPQPAPRNYGAPELTQQKQPAPQPTSILDDEIPF
jgi:hypothetical protein